MSPPDGRQAAVGGICSFLFLSYIEGIVAYSSAALDDILAAVPSGAAQEARQEIFKLSLCMTVHLQDAWEKIDEY